MSSACWAACTTRSTTCWITFCAVAIGSNTTNVALAGPCSSKTAIRTNHGCIGFILFDDGNDHISLDPNCPIRILMWWNGCVVVFHFSLTVGFSRPLTFLLSPISPLHLVRNSCGIPFREVDRHFPLGLAGCHQRISLIG